MRNPFPIAAVIALVIAGCGAAGGDKNDYVKSLNKAQATLQQSLSGLGDDIGAGSSGAQVAAKLENGGSAMDAAAEDFNRIEPPDDAKHAHGKIVDGLHEIAGTFRDAAEAAKANDLPKALQTLQDIVQSPGAKEIQEAEAELKSNGYKVEDGS